MKAFFVITLFFVGNLAHAAEVRGKILSIVNDDEGEKIVLAVGSGTNTAYLKNTHPSYEPLTELLGLAKESKKDLLINVDDEYLRFVKSVKIEKQQ